MTTKNKPVQIWISKLIYLGSLILAESPIHSQTALMLLGTKLPVYRPCYNIYLNNKANICCVFSSRDVQCWSYQIVWAEIKVCPAEDRVESTDCSWDGDISWFYLLSESVWQKRSDKLTLGYKNQSNNSSLETVNSIINI